MTDPLLITPPPELVQQWEGTAYDAAPIPYTHHIARCAAQWGADQELEACCAWILKYFQCQRYDTDRLRAIRRPKPPSLKEQALKQLRDMDQAGALDCNTDKIRAALEALDD
jgi:hypothetical protein